VVTLRSTKVEFVDIVGAGDLITVSNMPDHITPPDARY
jgi:hypothetical protein